ncbi:hypothetical protein SALBM135S_03280 [Streptomyces alboniger]
MSRTGPAPSPPRPYAWLRVLSVLVTVFAAAVTTPSVAAPPPPAALALPAEPGSEAQHDASETALRLPTRHATRLPTAARPGPPRGRAAPARVTPPRRTVQVPPRRSMVLRC